MKKYLITVLGTAKNGGVLNADFYCTVKKKLDTESQIEDVRKQAKEDILELDKSKGLVITHIFGPLKR